MGCCKCECEGECSCEMACIRMLNARSYYLWVLEKRGARTTLRLDCSDLTNNERYIVSRVPGQENGCSIKWPWYGEVKGDAVEFSLDNEPCDEVLELRKQTKASGGPLYALWKDNKLVYGILGVNFWNSRTNDYDNCFVPGWWDGDVECEFYWSAPPVEKKYQPRTPPCPKCQLLQQPQ